MPYKQTLEKQIIPSKLACFFFSESPPFTSDERKKKKAKLRLCWKKNKYKKDTRGSCLKITLDANASSRAMLRPRINSSESR